MDGRSAFHPAIKYTVVAVLVILTMVAVIYALQVDAARGAERSKASEPLVAYEVSATPVLPVATA